MSWYTIKKFIWAQKFRFDLGREFLPYVNFLLLVVATVGTFKELLGLSGFYVAPLLVVCTLFGMWVFGLVMDKIRSKQMDEEEWMKRSVGFKWHRKSKEELHKKLDRILEYQESHRG